MSEPTPQAAAPAAPAAQPPVPAQPDPRDAAISQLREENARLKADAKAASGVPAAPGDLQIKVEPPHAEFHFGNLHLGREFRAVPVALAAAIHNAAVEAGVRLTQKESES